jgi:hypothetical protein
VSYRIAFFEGDHPSTERNEAFDPLLQGFVAAFANPQQAMEQAYDRTKNFAYGMIFIAYSY